jgi:histidine ammonia-lyase
MAVRRLVQRLEADREVSGDINRLAFALREGDFVRAS